MPTKKQLQSEVELLRSALEGSENEIKALEKANLDLRNELTAAQTSWINSHDALVTVCKERDEARSIALDGSNTQDQLDSIICYKKTAQQYREAAKFWHDATKQAVK